MGGTDPAHGPTNGGWRGRRRRTLSVSCLSFLQFPRIRPCTPTATRPPLLSPAVDLLESWPHPLRCLWLLAGPGPALPCRWGARVCHNTCVSVSEDGHSSGDGRGPTGGRVCGAPSSRSDFTPTSIPHERGIAGPGPSPATAY